MKRLKHLGAFQTTVWQMAADTGRKQDMHELKYDI